MHVFKNELEVLFSFRTYRWGFIYKTVLYILGSLLLIWTHRV